ncbi:hypothetical protein FRC04_005007 [Tulasnella sp. 424]|nr:hypothetical protein FRC04_005007 [Tulasnella sp. 424]KAG8958857.1 hypothetical protein FRC05_008330 [Tulasnella sp. 425]
MFFKVFSSLSTRKPAGPTTPFDQPPSKLRGAVQSILKALNLRRSTPTHPSTETKNAKIIITSAVPLKTATPSTTASLAPLASISPLFAAQGAKSSTTPTTAFSGPDSPDMITASRDRAELEAAIAQLKRQEAHQARVLKKLEDMVSAGVEKFLSQRDEEVAARRLAEDRLAAEIVRRKRAEEWLEQEQDRCWDAEYEAGKVFRDLEELRKKKEAIERKIDDLERRSDFLAPDLVQEALERLGFAHVCDPDQCPMPGSCLPLFLEEVYTSVVLRDAGIAGRSAAGYYTFNDSEDED